MQLFKKISSPFVSNRILKIKRLESNLEDLEAELFNDYQKIGQVVYKIHQKGQRLPKELNKLFKEIWKIDKKKIVTLKEIDKVTARLLRAEEEPSVQMIYTNVCPKCEVVLLPEAKFCAECGTKAKKLKRQKKAKKISVEANRKPKNE